MHMNTRQDRFFSYIRDKLERIDDIVSDDLKLHKKILYVAFVDSLSALVYPAYSQNRSRFTEFVTRFGNWANSERVSTPHLARALRLNPDPAYDKVRKLVLGTLDSWRPGKLIPLSSDLEAGVVGTHWPSGKVYEQPVEGATWAHLKHVELLYAYRNSLVHGFRPLGTDPEMPEDQDPYYLSSHDSSHSEVHWELIYPTAFLRGISHSALAAVEQHIRGNQIDPVEVLRSGRFWIRALNK